MTKRREFIKKSVLASTAMSMPIIASSKKPSNPTPQTLLIPKKLQKGDTIGLIALGYAITKEMLQRSITEIEALGMKPYHTTRVFGDHGYFSNTDEERTNDVMHMFLNPEVDGMFCIRGGYGCTRILDMLDFDLIAKNPKILIGYSDITALLNAFYEKIGLVGFHGAMGAEPGSYAFTCVEEMLIRPKSKLRIENYNFDKEDLKNPVYDRYAINTGKAKGTLKGGNLSLLAAMTGTNYDIDYTDSLVCIEDVGEAPYRIDRMLTQLLCAPTFKKAAGIVFGICNGCDKKEDSNSFTLKEVIMDRIAPMGIPAVYGMSFGHIEESFTFPIGIEATLDTSNFTLVLEQKPLI